MQATTIINTLIQILFSGFALWSIILPLLLLFIKNTKANFIKEVDTTAVIIIRYAGIAYICHFIINIFLHFNDPDSQIFISRMFGKYWFGYWIYLFVYFFLPQLLWFKKIKDNAFIRIVIAIVIVFALHIEKFIILLASSQTPDIQGIAIGSSIQAIIIDCLYKLILFSAIVLLIHFVIHWRKKKNSNYI